MNEIDGWVKIKKYTDDEGKPICGKCVFGPMDNCNLNKWDAMGTRWAPGPDCEVWHGESKSDRLLAACQAAYKKHHLNDDSIGWNELDTILLDALCSSMGEGEFNSWLFAQENKPCSG